MNSIQPKISVIIPTYNRSRQLSICLNSLAKQTYKNFEVIVCDDGSTDNTEVIIENFKDVLNLKYIKDENFGGPAKPRNNGLRAAQGEIIAFLDSDDFWYHNKLEVSLNLLNDYDLLYHNLDIYENNVRSKNIKKGRNLSGDYSKDLILNGNAIVNSSVLIKKSIVEKVGYFTEDKRLIAVEDLDYWIRVSSITNLFKYVNQSLGGYCVGENISYSEKQIERINFLIYKYFPQLTSREKKSAITLVEFISARNYHSNSKFLEAKKSYRKAMNTNKISMLIKSIIGYLMCYIRIK